MLFDYARRVQLCPYCKPSAILISEAWSRKLALLQICFRHCGTCQFRGVPETQTVLQISRGALDGRVFPPGFANPKKATSVGAAKGLQAILVLNAQ